MSNKIIRTIIIDDEEADNYVHKINIESTGKGEVIKSFLKAEEALDWLKLKPQKIDLIFLDINMPEMDGFTFLKHYHLLEKQHKAERVIIMLTSSLSNSDKEKAIQNNVKFETKPLTKERFIKLVEDLDFN